MNMLQLIKKFFAWLKKIFCPSKKEPELVYFLPNEIVLQIRHPEATPEETPGESLDERRKKMQGNILNALQSLLESKPPEGYEQQDGIQEASPEQKWRSELNAPTLNSKIITFPFADESGRVFSLVPITLKGYDSQNDLKPERAISILRQAYAELRQNGPLILATDISLDGFSPNWLTSDLHHGAATGGPGSRPVQASDPRMGEQNFRLTGSAASLLSSITTALPSANVQDVHVAILDTVPSVETITRARHDRTDHLLVQELFSPTVGRLIVHRADQATLDSLQHFSPALHDYPMPDHGTFIAGVIHEFARSANVQLHLYEVLNNYGVGSFTSVAQGIVDVLNNTQIERPLIINCSFMFCLPDGDAGMRLLRDLDVPISSLSASIRQVFEGITDPNITIVASAGNDAEPGRRRPDARYPAAFNNVIGVGALPKGNPRDATTGRYIPASYSNLADNPSNTGFVTLGGEPGNSQGVLGMYISDFPGPNPINRTGWAWWSGTSFAAAIITGLLAADRVGLLAPGARGAPGESSTDSENVILVEQG